MGHTQTDHPHAPLHTSAKGNKDVTLNILSTLMDSSIGLRGEILKYLVGQDFPTTTSKMLGELAAAL